MSMVPVTVTTAVELSSTQRKDVETVIQDKFHASSKQVAYQVDSAVLGGIRITVGSRQYDATVAAKLARMREQIEE